MEAGLRLFPGVIPVALLHEFEPSVRATIASRRKLPLKADTVAIPRDDGGPARTMWIYKPLTQVTLDFDEPGIVKTVRTDRMGFCNPSPDAYDVDEIDIAALGDSFTWCTSVEPASTWPYRLADLTGRSTYNFGLPGRGLYEYLQILERFALPKSPEVVILNVYEGNDLRDAVRFREAVSTGDGPSTSRPCPFPSAAFCDAYRRLAGSSMARHSYAYNLLLAAAWRVAYLAQKRQIDFRYSVLLPDGEQIVFNSLNQDLDEVGHARAFYDGVIGTDLFDEALDRFMQLSRQHGFTPIVVYTPSAYTAYMGQARFDDPAIAEILRSYSSKQRAYFSAQAKELGYAFVDTTPALRHAARILPADQVLYFRTNVHLTQKGHEVVAGAIATSLASGSQSAL